MAARPRVTLCMLAAVVLAMAGFPTPHVSAASATARVVELTNAKRQSLRGPGCPSLVENSALMSVAQGHAAEMAGSNYFSHRSLSGAMPWQRVAETGYQPRRVAENIAAGQPTPEEVVAGWMRSPGHRANILNCRLREIGVGFAYNDRSTYGNYWVQLFAAHR